MGVDFEERVDYRRLHRYRLAARKQALEKSDLGALLLFDVNNIRYVTSTKIGEWERDKLSRWALLIAPASRSSGTSARRPCITSSIRRGSSREIAGPGLVGSAAPSTRRSA
jgi:Xaa-Pro dipeptidase